MNIENLMSGIAVVIDDAFAENGSAESTDMIIDLVASIEKKWKIPFYKTDKIPSEDICKNLLQSASFIVLDWKLWPSNSSELEEDGIKANIKFLEQAKDYFVPVFIFTNETKDDIADKISNIYDKDNPERNFIFIKSKSELVSAEFSAPIEDWLKENASVYTLKTWEQAFYKAKRDIFSSMYKKSPDWPKVFWKSYKCDGVDPGSSITTLINDSLLGRIVGDFDAGFFGDDFNVPKKDIQSVLEEVSFIQKENISENEIRAGDLFKIEEGNYLLNIRPDCDCIARNGGKVDCIELYCLEGEEFKDSIKKSYNKENVSEAIIFPVDRGKVVKIHFRTLQIKRFSDLKEKRIGRLIHPYITKIQQRYAFYLQRQGLPRIPKEAIP